VTSPYRPHPVPPPPRPHWGVGYRVVVRYRPTTGTVLGSLEGQYGIVMEGVDLDDDGVRDQIVRVRFGVEAWASCPTHARRFLDLVMGPDLGPRGHILGVENWIFAGDLEQG